uniref:Uncharacterized protein n=1 Tax=viral metagenome TaxID=1070528 RepID=A0A6M3L4H8_9ZZZZ
MPTKDKGAIKKFGGGRIYIMPVSDAGADAGLWIDLGYLQDTVLSDVTETEEIQDETGNTIASNEGNRLVKLSGTLMQSDKVTLDYMVTTVRGAYYRIYQYTGIVNGYYQEVVYGICQFKPQLELASGTKRIPFEASILKNEAALAETGMQAAITADGLTPTSYCAGTTVPAAGYYIIVETIVP